MKQEIQRETFRNTHDNILSNISMITLHLVCGLHWLIVVGDALKGMFIVSMTTESIKEASDTSNYIWCNAIVSSLYSLILLKK